jgi:hypothetical protein
MRTRNLMNIAKLEKEIYVCSIDDGSMLGGVPI